MQLQDLVFNDCMIVGYSRDAAARSLTLTFEAYGREHEENGPALHVLECSGVDDVRLHFSPEFATDLNRSYQTNGNDQCANEIYELRREASGYIHLVADMVRGSFYCKKFRLLRVIAAEAEA